MDDQDVATEDLIAGMPEWVGMLAIRQCVKAGDHERDYPGACRKHRTAGLAPGNVGGIAPVR